MLSDSVVLIKKINLLCLRHWHFPGKLMNFSEAATRGVLWKKLFFKILQYSQESRRFATFLKTDSKTGVFLWILQNLWENLIQRTSANKAASDFLKQLQNSGKQLLLYWLFWGIAVLPLSMAWDVMEKFFYIDTSYDLL